MTVIQQERWFDRSRRAAGGKGPAQGALDEDVQQFVQLANLDTWEYDFLARVKQNVFPFIVTAVAAQNSQASIKNPANSNVLVFLDLIELWTSVAAMTVDIQVLLPGTDSALAAQTRTSQDFRLNNNPLAVSAPSSVIVRAGTSAAAQGATWGSLGWRVILNLNETFQFPRRIVLPPDWGINLFSNTPNQGLAGFFQFKERPFDPSELT